MKLSRHAQSDLKFLQIFSERESMDQNAAIHCLQLSHGYVARMLAGLVDIGYLESQGIGRKTQYTLTPAGREFLKRAEGVSAS